MAADVILLVVVVILYVFVNENPVRSKNHFFLGQAQKFFRGGN